MKKALFCLSGFLPWFWIFFGTSRSCWGTRGRVVNDCLEFIRETDKVITNYYWSCRRNPCRFDKMLAKWETLHFSKGKILIEGVYQQTSNEIVCEQVIKPAVNTALEIQSTKRRTDIQLKLNELQNNNREVELNSVAAQHLEAAKKDLSCWSLPSSGWPIWGH